MTPSEFIFNGLHAACDNAHDMGLKSEAQIGGLDWWVEGDPPPLNQEQYAVSVITDDICCGSGDDFPESPYLEQWDDDDELVPAPCKRVLRLALGDALTEFHKKEEDSNIILCPDCNKRHHHRYCEVTS